ncbi:hypothetical protein AVEN_257813-1 [Araneus ventricosus]|uniref:Uncharacterized protein n=1 Tax=Araneus ventricosus TaxID=182803 RepID=A0A4Y2UKI7_ARAVE|nr:hypothetical protein AVEN_257813-1 [Araneus ventricosus]
MFTPARTTGVSHLFIPSGGVYHRWLPLIYPIRRSVPPVAPTYLSHQAECTTGVSHLFIPSGGVYHRWFALICPIRRRVPPVAPTYLSHQAACITGGSH